MPEAGRSADPGHLAALLLYRAQKRFGAARLELGAVLTLFQEYELWRGRAASFAALLEEQRINASAARQYMRVAKAFFFGLQLDAERIDDLAAVPMNILDLAARVITPDNAEDVIATVTTLRERDARAALEGMLAGAADDPAPARAALAPPANKVLNGFFALPDDQRIDVMHRLMRGSPPPVPPARAECDRESP